VNIRQLQPADWPRVEAIYAAGISTGNATFELEPPTRERFTASHTPELCFVAEDQGAVVGWVAAGPVSDRCVYTGVVEHSVYVDLAAQGRGIGRLLLGALIERTEALDIWTIQSGVFPENTASLRLHEACGFRIVGRRERVGQHHGCWRDVVVIERRSKTIGLD